MTFAWHCRYRLHAAAAADVASIPFSLVDCGLCVTACSQILHDATGSALCTQKSLTYGTVSGMGAGWRMEARRASRWAGSPCKSVTRRPHK